jgi:hypothetical protein
MFVLLHLFLEAAVWMDTQPFESMTTRDPAKLRCNWRCQLVSIPTRPLFLAL